MSADLCPKRIYGDHYLEMYSAYDRTIDTSAMGMIDRKSVEIREDEIEKD